MADNDLIIVGLALLALYLLGNRGQQQAPAAASVQGMNAGGCSQGGVDMCAARQVGGGSGSTSPGSPPAAQSSYWQQTPGASAGVMRPADVDYSNPRLGSAVNDATLLMINRQIDQANAAGNWDLSWQLAARRDAWIKQQGY